MPKIKLLTSYLDDPAGTVTDKHDQGKCDELVVLGRAEYVEEPAEEKKEEPKEKVIYENKMMTSLTCECGKVCKSKAGLKRHQTACKK